MGRMGAGWGRPSARSRQRGLGCGRRGRDGRLQAGSGRRS
uniref:Uncharacterized protein n=1 Tax=Arundo donax TaxID=35708 RepID=A0A0A8ZR04_ARUDO